MPIDQVPSSLTANAGSGTMAVFFSPANPAVAATFSGTVGVNLGRQDGTLAVQFDPGHELGSIRGITQSIAVYFDRGNPSVAATFSGTLAVTPITGSSHPMWEENYNAVRTFFAGSNPNSSLVVNAGAGTFNVQFDPGHELGTIRGNTNTLTVFLPDTGHELGSIRGITNSINVYLGSTAGTIQVALPTGTIAVSLDPGHTLGKIEPGVGTFQVFLPDTGHELGTIRGNTNTLTVFLPDTGHELGSIRGITNSINVYLGGTAGTVVVKIDPAGVAFINAGHTASIFTTSGGNASAVSVSGATVISPSANYSFKIFAFSITSTAQSNILAKFTNGAGTSPTEFWRLPLQAPSQGFAGANLAVTPPGYLFATGASTTLSIVVDSASLVHYSVSYIKEVT